jgi:hypothetical protein
METRELYKQKFEAQLREWSAKLDALEAHADKVSAEAKIAAKPHLDTVHAQVQAAKAKLHQLAETTEDKWDDATKGAEHVWIDVKASLEGAYDALQKHGKDA